MKEKYFKIRYNDVLHQEAIVLAKSKKEAEKVLKEWYYSDNGEKMVWDDNVGSRLEVKKIEKTKNPM